MSLTTRNSSRAALMAGYLVDRPAHDDAPGHAAHGLHRGRAVEMRVIPVEAGGVIVGQPEDVFLAMAGTDGNHRRQRIGGANRLEQVRDDVHPVEMQVGGVESVGDVVIAGPAGRIVGSERVRQLDAYGLTGPHLEQRPRHLSVVAAQLHPRAVECRLNPPAVELDVARRRRHRRPLRRAEAGRHMRADRGATERGQEGPSRHIQH